MGRTGGKKGQMFIITMVFLVGLVFVVQQGFVNWFAYSIDFYSETQKNDYYLFNNAKDMTDQTFLGSATCTEARNNLNDLTTFFNTRVLTSYFLEFSYSLECGNWPNTAPADPPLDVTIHIKGENTDTQEDFSLYRF